ncbi:MAG TPA: type II toxin-antitoxin system VapC family toxin [Thermomicrobiales bacterium]|nr:type II toxin-antitoxin system VapC family toxin [Thermomicrobiales bacterium]
MGGLTSILYHHRLIGLDTSIFIYHIQADSRFSPLATTVLESVSQGICQGVTPLLTLMELAVKPLQVGRPDLADEYEIFVSNIPHLDLVRLERPVMRRAALLRAQHRLRPADSLQLAACLEHGATAFFTNDKRLRRLTETEIVVLDDFLDD